MQESVRHSSSSPKVALLGASGGIGQPLGLLLKQDKLIANLALYDVVNTPGVAADLSHIDTNAKVDNELELFEKFIRVEGKQILESCVRSYLIFSVRRTS